MCASIPGEALSPCNFFSRPYSVPRAFLKSTRTSEQSDAKFIPGYLSKERSHVEINSIKVETKDNFGKPSCLTKSEFTLIVSVFKSYVLSSALDLKRPCYMEETNLSIQSAHSKYELWLLSESTD